MYVDKNPRSIKYTWSQLLLLGLDLWAFSFFVFYFPNIMIFRNDLIKTKINIILVILSFCVICAIILSFVNSSDDFEEMNNFYHGYMGRRLLIQERRLVYRGQVDRINKSRVIPSYSSELSQYQYLRAVDMHCL